MEIEHHLYSSSFPRSADGLVPLFEHFPNHIRISQKCKNFYHHCRIFHLVVCCNTYGLCRKFPWIQARRTLCTNSYQSNCKGCSSDQLLFVKSIVFLLGWCHAIQHHLYRNLFPYGCNLVTPILLPHGLSLHHHNFGWYHMRTTLNCHVLCPSL